MQKMSKQDTVYDVQLLDHRKLISLMQFGDLESCADTFESYLDSVNFYSLESLMLRLYIGMDVYLAARNVSRGFGISNEEFVLSFGSLDDISANMKTVESTGIYLHRIVAQCIRWRIAPVPVLRYISREYRFS